jgi:hypothetical protein
MSTIDFTNWKDAQLKMTPDFMFGDQLPLAQAEIQRRKDEGIWLTDGSTERVAQMIRDNTPASRRKLSRRVRR